MSEQQIIRNGESYDLDTHECGECRYFNECPCSECLWGVCINTYSRDNGHSKNLARHSKASQVFSDGFSDGHNKHETVRQDELSDTREKLEADVANILRNAASHTSANTSIGDMLRYTVPGSGAAPWQTAEDACEALASIAERQIAELIAEQNQFLDERDCMARRALDLEAECDKLEAERDQLSRDMTAEHALLLQFEDDNERLKKANRIQAESFRKLEVELAKMKEKSKRR